MTRCVQRVAQGGPALARTLVAALLLVTSLLVAAPPCLAAQPTSEDALRQRVHRFYVLSFLNRHGEMWEMFTPSLQERLGGDRKAYVRDARGTGFELYQSQVEKISIEEGRGIVDVRLQVQLPGSVSMSWRSHRMLWRHENGAWLYAGSKDITRDDSPGAPSVTEIEALPGTGLAAPEPAPEPARLLPPSPPPKAAAPEPRPAPVADPQAVATVDRWDLVAIPPTDKQQGEPRDTPQADAAKPPQSAEPRAPPPPPAAPAIPPRVARDVEATLLPPEQASPPEPSGRPGPESPGAPFPPGDDESSLSDLVRKAASGNPLRRLRALARLRDVSDVRVVPLVAEALGDAPPESQAVFLERLAALGGPEHVPLARALLTAEAITVRAAAVAAMGELGSSAEAPAVGELLSDVSSDVRAAALTALGRLGGAPGPLLLPVLSDARRAEPELVAAALAAGRADAEDCEAALLALIARGVPPLAVAAAMEGLGRMATPRGVERLTQLTADGSLLAVGGSQVPTRLVAARSLALSGHAGSGVSLARALGDFSDQASSADVDRVASTGEPEALLALLGNGRASVRKRAAELVGRSLVAADDRPRALEALEAARDVETDPRTLVTLQAALERLRAGDAPILPR